MQGQSKQLQAKNDIHLQSKVIASNVIIKGGDEFLGDERARNSTLYNAEVFMKESLLDK